MVCKIFEPWPYSGDANDNREAPGESTFQRTDLPHRGPDEILRLGSNEHGNAPRPGVTMDRSRRCQPPDYGPLRYPLPGRIAGTDWRPLFRLKGSGRLFNSLSFRGSCAVPQQRVQCSSASYPTSLEADPQRGSLPQPNVGRALSESTLGSTTGDFRWGGRLHWPPLRTLSASHDGRADLTASA